LFFVFAFQGWVTALCCAGSSVYSASSDKTVVCWDAASRTPLHVQCDHSSYVKALLLCKWQLWSLSKDSLHVTAADGVFSSLQQHLQLSQSECRAMSTAVVSLGSRIEELKQQVQVCCLQLPITSLCSSNLVFLIPFFSIFTLTNSGLATR
jgi:hypothetical protein